MTELQAKHKAFEYMQAGNVLERSVVEQAVRFEPVKGKRNSPGSELISQLTGVIILPPQTMHY